MIGERTVEGLGPKVAAGRSVDDLYVDAHGVAGPLYTALDEVADAQLLGDTPHVAGLASIGEGGIAGDDEEIVYLRKSGGQVVGDPIDDGPLRRIATEIVQRQDSNRWPVRHRLESRRQAGSLARPHHRRHDD